MQNGENWDASIQGLEVSSEKAPPTKVKAKVRYNCFDPNCNFKNRDSPLDTYVKHLNDKHNINMRHENESYR